MSGAGGFGGGVVCEFSEQPFNKWDDPAINDADAEIQPLYISPQMPPMSDKEITLLLAKEMSHAVSNGLNMQQMALRLCRAVRGER